ncbi:monofunctional biosynthetic peptidoglycan transglycosylase [Luteibacter sp. UNCMF331Sha3.1]|uniref:monofunctional biosynthetic peptidoglycan transglycosylase n=1 Tax=Luteibacter sp. UNCMF331Sha3.1 TaxID=1502760 RepID=UPI0008D32437|nr:monofunctional biosynthetic peptidoglycan transglycosylase [Luteibacter sp. UNCMF331Sha3.1]SEM33258.1 monofunctional biosynthetic peptidoglycan transglycosylase [Luteibacter sp. UNCMF331Sha3.1]
MIPTHRSPLRRIVRIACLLVVAWLALSCVVVFAFRFIPPWTSAMMMERRVEAWVTGEHDFTLRHRWVPWGRISPQVGIAMVAGEDQKFPYHHGFDVDAIQDAIDAADEGKRLRGASTISQQVAKNLFLWNGRSFVRKGLEAWFTVLIETLWPKQRILEVYMNTVELGNGVYGVGAAADAFYRGTPDRLDATQSARLAAVLPNPRRFRVDAPSAYVQRRTAWIARQVVQLGGPAYLSRPAPVSGRVR